VGRNTDIKRFDALQAGQPIDLFESAHGRLPVVLELLGTGDGGGRRAEVAIEVDWDGEHARPAWFEYRGKRYTVDEIVSQWAVESRWWDRRTAVSRRCFRVLARDGVWDLAYDRAREEWMLTGVVD
jgi:hypothetical protein